MTQREMRRIVEGWQERLGLRHWQIKIDFTVPSRPGTDATIHKSDDYFDARVRFVRSWRSWSVWLANYIACHELLHLLMRDMDWANEQALDRLGPSDRGLLEDIYSHAQEGVIDRLANELVTRAGVIK